VEWVVQMLQMEHAEEVPGLRTTRTLEALEAARDAGLIDEHDASELATAWRMATAIRNGVMLVRGRPGDMVPIDVRELRAVAFVLGYPVDASGRMVDDYRRVTRRARLVFDRLFYGMVDDAP
jgi:glutamate-ammonia-ligase adenylyltransferase